MKEGKWLIPDVIAPVDTVCIKINIPNDFKHIQAFWGALNTLGNAWNWEESFAEGSLVAYHWQTIIDATAEEVRQGLNCMVDFDCTDVEACLALSAIIIAMQADIATNTGNIGTNASDIADNVLAITANANNITDNDSDILALQLDATQQAITIALNTGRIVDLEVDATQQAITLADHETRITVLENESGGGGGGGGQNIATTSYGFDVPIDVNNNTTTFITALSFQHTFTYVNSMIIIECRLRSGGTAHTARVRIMVGGIAGNIEGWAKGTTQVSTQVSSVFEDIVIGDRTVILQLASSSAQEARLLKDQKVQVSIIEYSSIQLPIPDTVTFDTGGQNYVLPVGQVGFILAVGNPDNCLYGSSIAAGSYIEVEFKTPSHNPETIDDVQFDMWSSQTAIVNQIDVYLDDVFIYGFTSINTTEAWFTRTVGVGGGFPQVGTTVRVRMTAKVGYTLDDARMDNLMAIVL